MPDVASKVQPIVERVAGTPLQNPVFAVGLLGGALLVAGARLYRLAIVAPGLVGGVLLGLALTEGASPNVKLAAALALGIMGAALLFVVERLAISLGGAFVMGGLANAVAPAFLPEPTPWYVPAAGAVVGLFLFPRLFKSLLFVLTSLGGALCVAWAMGDPQNLPLIGGLWLGGAVIQWFTRPGKKE